MGIGSYWHGQTAGQQAQMTSSPTYTGVTYTPGPTQSGWTNTGATGSIFPAQTQWTVATTGSTFNPAYVPAIPDVDTVAILPDGRILCVVQGMKIAIPARLFKDVVALSEMGLLKDLVGEGETPAP